MIQGKSFNPDAPELKDARQQARQLCAEVQLCPPSDSQQRNQFLQQLLPHSRHSLIESGFQVEYGSQCHIGKGTFINHNVMLIDVCRISIGNQVLIGPNTVISSATERFSLTNNAQLCKGKPVTIGHRVWIGANVRIAAGVTIGDNAVIGAGSHVTDDVPANFIAFGKPAACQRKIQQNTQ